MDDGRRRSEIRQKGPEKGLERLSVLLVVKPAAGNLLATSLHRQAQRLKVDVGRDLGETLVEHQHREQPLFRPMGIFPVDRRARPRQRELAVVRQRPPTSIST